MVNANQVLFCREHNCATSADEESAASSRPSLECSTRRHGGPNQRALEMMAVPSLIDIAGTVDTAAATGDIPPDGGLAAWLSVTAGFFVIMNSWGIIISFGIFQTYYVSNLHLPPSDISWIGSLAVFLLFFGGIASGRLTDAGYFRPTTTLGSFLIVFGSFITSLYTTYWQLVLAQGIYIGIGNGFLLTPIMTVVSTYFRRKLPLAMGITACGSVVGGLIYTSIARALLPTIGFRWTLRAIAFIQLDFITFKEPEFNLFILGLFFSFMGVFFGFFYLASYARDVNGMPYIDSLNLLLVLNGISVVGRLLPSPLAKLFGTLNTFIVLMMASAIAVGGVQSLMPAAIAVLNSDLRNVGSRLGIAFAAVGIGSLIGSPIAGVLITARAGSYVGAQAFSGSALAAGALLILAAREIRRRKTSASFWSKL
ncbi:major facilitator superfamily domain-containing protein [Triangularia verruculosa]|uniref:Major facilitator superfamily domain-containing protein n=1 Tax=Triangularia verruculosa TaxID=2587418 RepID=A0AAN7AMK8_9PEZI|nr:major facilitator superfamily domain-containing protein [Triangularia verruculosa]